MNAREKILEEIKATKPLSAKVLDIEIEGIRYQDKKQQFMQILYAIGGKVVEFVNNTEVQNYLAKIPLNGKKLVTVLANEKLNFSNNELYGVNILVIKGGIAVAENGAIWISEKNMGNRVLPFSCEELIILIEEKNIVNNMHEVYKLINIAEDGYGVFIAGPSKTADIEQSLVIGAHGPISLSVFIVNE